MNHILIGLEVKFTKKHKLCH